MLDGIIVNLMSSLIGTIASGLVGRWWRGRAVRLRAAQMWFTGRA